jgi:hypothetical protein
MHALASRLVRRILAVRWHPDKWAKVTQKMARHAELGPLGERLRDITQMLVSQKDMG